MHGGFHFFPKESGGGMIRGCWTSFADCDPSAWSWMSLAAVLVLFRWGTSRFWGVMGPAFLMSRHEFSRKAKAAKPNLKVPTPKGRAKWQEPAELGINMLAEDRFCGQVEKEEGAELGLYRCNVNCKVG
jgi:hypothetical protein